MKGKVQLGMDVAASEFYLEKEKLYDLDFKTEKNDGSKKVIFRITSKFCTVCNIPLCVYCKINGSHSKNESATHLVEKIEDAYKKTMIESKEVELKLINVIVGPIVRKKKRIIS